MALTDGMMDSVEFNLVDLVLEKAQSEASANPGVSVNDLLVQFVADLDNAQYDWEFTKALHKWAKAEIKVGKAEGYLR